MTTQQKLKKLKEIVKIHGLTLLNLYGVKEDLVKKHPEALKAFVNILNEEIYEMDTNTK